MARDCSEQGNTCSNCTGTHKTVLCLHLHVTRCVSCKSDEHASWSWQCPNFLKRVAEFKECNPESLLPYFSTVDPWTWTTDTTNVTHMQKILSSPKKAPLNVQKGKEKASAGNAGSTTQQDSQDLDLADEAWEREFREWWGDPHATRLTNYTNQPTQSFNITQSGTTGPSDV